MEKIICPKKYKLYCYDISVGKMKIRIRTNSEKIVFKVVAKGIIEAHVGNKSDYKKEIIAILSDSLKENIVSDDKIIEERKMHENDSEKIYCNKKYVGGEYIIDNYVYPNNTIHLYDKKLNTYFVFSQREDVLLFYIKRIIKDMATQYFIKQGYYRIHSGAVSDESGAIVFMGKGEAGKSTLCTRALALNNVYYINDDLCFIKYVNKTWVVRSIPTTINIRSNALQYIEHFEQVKKASLYSEYQDAYIFPVEKYQINEVPIKKVLIIGDEDGLVENETLYSSTDKKEIKNFMGQNNAKMVRREGTFKEILNWHEDADG